MKKRDVYYLVVYLGIFIQQWIYGETINQNGKGAIMTMLFLMPMVALVVNALFSEKLFYKLGLILPCLTFLLYVSIALHLEAGVIFYLLIYLVCSLIGNGIGCGVRNIKKMMKGDNVL